MPWCGGPIETDRQEGVTSSHGRPHRSRPRSRPSPPSLAPSIRLRERESLGIGRGRDPHGLDRAGIHRRALRPVERQRRSRPRRSSAEPRAAQMATLAFHSAYAGGTNEPAIELAEKLSALVYPSINTFFFTSGGAEASETSFKTARFYWKAVGKPDKFKVISRMRAYHGLTLAAMSATGLPAFWPMFEPRTPGFSHIDAPDPYRFVTADTGRQPRCRRGQQARRGDPARRPRHRGGIHRRAGAGRRRRHRAARRLLRRASATICDQVRRAVDRRRSDHRLRPHRTMVRPRALRRRARHHAVREGHHQRLHPARRHRRVRRGARGRSTACRRASAGCTRSPTPATRRAVPSR